MSARDLAVQDEERGLHGRTVKLVAHVRPLRHTDANVILTLEGEYDINTPTWKTVAKTEAKTETLFTRLGRRYDIYGLYTVKTQFRASLFSR